MAEGMDLTQAGMLLGTPAYLAPERIEGKPASAATDIYSVGVMMYEFLSGQKPFEADTPLGLIRAIQDEPVPSLTGLRPDVDPAFAAVIERAMHRDPAIRYASASEMEADLAGNTIPVAAAGETAVLGAANPTKVMTAPGAQEAGTEPTLVARPTVKRTRTSPWQRLTRRNRIGVVIAGALVLLSLIFVRSFSGETPATAPTPAASASPAGTTAPATGPGDVPAPLENALQKLEGAVEP
jgi:serine/threonine-protein kinase